MSDLEVPSTTFVEKGRSLKRSLSGEPETETKKKKEEHVVISEEEFVMIAEQLDDKKWKTLALHLGFKIPEIERIEDENSNSAIEYAITKMLVSWRNRNATAGLRMKLARTLIKIKRHDLAKCVIDIKYPNTYGEDIPDLAYNRMIIDVEDTIDDKMLKTARRLLGVRTKFTNPECLTQYLKDYCGVRRTNVCFLQSLLENLKCKNGLEIVDSFGRKNNYVVFLFKPEPNQDIDNTSVKFKLKCNPGQLSPDELGHLLKQLQTKMHMDVDCVVRGISEGCTCLTVDIPNAYIPCIKNTMTHEPSVFERLGIFQVIINGEHYPDPCYIEHELCQTIPVLDLTLAANKRGKHYGSSSPDVYSVNISPFNSELQGKRCQNSPCSSYEITCEPIPTCRSSNPSLPYQDSTLPPRGTVVKTALKNVLSLKYRELDHMEPNFGNPIHHTLSDNYVEVDLKQKEDGRSVKPCAILQNGKRGEKRTILIQGRTGFGKTTFCKKLVYDWATSRDVVFGNKIPFFLKARELITDTNIPACHWGPLRQAIFSRLVPVLPNVNLTHDEIWLFIQSNSIEFLFILDGLDEASEDVLTNLKEFIDGAYLPFSTIIVTSTTDIFQDDVKFDSHLVLEGFSEYQVKTCVKKLFKNRSDDEDLFIKEIKKSNLIELSECPLFLVLLSLMFQEQLFCKLRSKLPSSWTDLLTHFSMFLVRRCERKENGRKSGNYDNFKDMPQSYISMMYNLGKAALNTLTKKSQALQLNQEDGILAERIGLITKSSIVSPLKVMPSYVPIHKIMLDFLAAFYLKYNSEPYPVDLLLDKNMMMVAKFLTGLLDIEGKSSDLLQLFVVENVQNHELTAACLEECSPKNKQYLLKYLGSIVSEHTFLNLGFISKESTDTLACLYNMLKDVTPSNIKIMKIEASEVFFGSDNSAVVFAKIVKCIPNLIAINFPRLMLASQICSVINELKEGHIKQRYTSMEKISLVSDIDSSECSEKVVEMLTFFPRLNELELHVAMNAEASSSFLKGVCHHIFKRTHFLEDIEVLDLSRLTLRTENDCEYIMTTFSELRNLKRLIVPRQVVKHLYPRYYRNIQTGKYILHKMPLFDNVKLSVFLQIDSGQITESPKSLSIELSYNPLSCSDFQFGTLSVPVFDTADNTYIFHTINSTSCDILENAEGLLVLTYWDDVLGHERALHPDCIKKLSPSTVYLHSITSGNTKMVAELVDRIMVKKVVLNDSSCASLATFNKMGFVTMDGINTVDLTECTEIEKAADAILSFPNVKTINVTENLNPMSLLQELTNSEKQVDIQQINLSCKSESSIEVLKSVSIQFDDACVSPTSITLKNPNRPPPANKISILLKRDPKILKNLTWVKRIQFQGDSYRFLKRFSRLLDESKDSFRNLTIIEFVKGEDIDYLSNDLMNDIRSKIAQTCPLLLKLNPSGDPIWKSLECPSYIDKTLFSLPIDENAAVILKSLGNMYDEVYLSSSELRLAISPLIVDTPEDQSRYNFTVQSDPKLLIELPHIKKLTIKQSRNQMVLFRSWVIALEELGEPCYYRNLQTLDLKGSLFRSRKSLQMLAKVIEYTPNLHTIKNAKVESRYQSSFRKFLMENKLVTN